MAASWFYNHRGRLQGPLVAESIVEKIKAGELGPDDLVYQDGENKWKPISSVEKFSQHIPQKAKDSAKKSAAERQWVVLDRKKGQGNKQLGPYSTEEIRGMLIRGELKLSDYVWRSGMKEWYRVQVFPELVEGTLNMEAPKVAPEVPEELPEQTQADFKLPEHWGFKKEEVSDEAPVPLPPAKEKPPMNEDDIATVVMKNPLLEEEKAAKKKSETPKKAESKVKSADPDRWEDKKVPEVPAAKVKKKPEEEPTVIEFKHKTLPKDEPKPKEATGPDLTKSKVDPRDLSSLETRVNYKLRPEAKQRVIQSVGVEENWLQKTIETVSEIDRRWVVSGIACLLIVVLGRGIVQKMRGVAGADTPPEVAASELNERVNKPVPAANKPKKAVQAARPTPPPKPTAVPTPTPVPRKEATYVKLEYNPSTAVLVLKTDATDNFRATWEFTSLFGKIVGANSYHRILKRQDRDMELQKLSWPRGYYEVEAQMNGHKSRATVFVGPSRNYATDLQNHKKQLTMDWMNERVAFIKVAEELADKSAVFEKILRAAGNSTAWNRDYPSWRRQLRKTDHPNIRRIGVKTRDRYVMAKMWLELKEARDDLDRFTRSMSSRSKRTTSSSGSDARAITQKLRSLADQAQGLSLWR